MPDRRQFIGLGERTITPRKFSSELLDRCRVVSHRVLSDRRIIQAANMRWAGHSEGYAPG